MIKYKMINFEIANDHYIDYNELNYIINISVKKI